MTQTTLEELEEYAAEILKKGKQSAKLDADEIADEPESEEEEEIEEDDEAEDEEDDSDEDMEKSVVTDLLGTEEGSAAVVSGLVEVFAKSLAEVLENVADSRERSENASSTLAKSMLAQNVIMDEQKADIAKTGRRLSKLEKSLNERLDAIEEKLDGFAAQPARMRKSVNSYNIADRNFRESVGGAGADEQPLSKAQILNILTSEMENGSAVVRARDVLAVEAGAPIRPEIRALIDSKTAR